MERKNRIVWIDFIKGIACLIVVCSHFTAAFTSISSTMKIIIEIPLRPFLNGSLMVCVFAILSGYLSSFSLGKKFALIKRLIRRYLQLMLPILATGVIVFILWNTIGFAPENIRVAIGGGDYTYLEKLTLGETLFEAVCGVLFLGQCRINPAFWMMKSLFIGSIGTLILTYIIYFIPDKKYLHILITILSIGCSILVKDHVIMCVLFGFLIGMLKKYQMLKKFRNKYLNIVLLIFSFVMAGWGHHYAYLIITKYIISLPASLDSVAKWLAIYSAIFVYAFDNLESLQDFLSSKYLQALGKYSMGIYCFHNIFIWTVGVYVLYGLNKIGLVYDLGFVISLLFVILCTCIVAKFYEEFVNLHVEKILRKIR